MLKISGYVKDLINTLEFIKYIFVDGVTFKLENTKLCYKMMMQ